MSFDLVDSKQKVKLKITYYDEDGAEVSELFDFSNNKQRDVFNREYGRRFNNGSQPKQLTSAEQAIELQFGFTHPDFVVARKAKHFWQIQQKVFDYQGAYRKANEL